MTNDDRAKYGHKAVKKGSPDYGKNGSDEDGKRTDVIDALANIMHYCAREAIPFTECVESATMHYTAEAFGDAGE